MFLPPEIFWNISLNELFEIRWSATTGIFSILQFCWKCLLKRRKRFFPQKSPFLDIIFNFTKLKTFLVFFSRKNLTIEVEKTFSRRDIIWCTFYSKYASITDIEKYQFFFEKKFVRFEKSYYFSRILWQIWNNLVEEIQFLNLRIFIIGPGQLQINVKKRTFWMNDFTPPYIWAWSWIPLKNIVTPNNSSGHIDNMAKKLHTKRQKIFRSKS